MLLRQMRYFCSVVDAGSFTRAAEAEFVSQSAISQQVKALETSLGAELVHRGVELPLPSQASTTAGTRVEAGNQKQVDYFGESMRHSWETGPAERARINRWLAGNCFGDWYTRGGLFDRDREMVTFCLVVAQGGCEPQATAHAAANLSMGNDLDYLYRVVSSLVPYIGYPRCLNALSCIDRASAQRG